LVWYWYGIGMVLMWYTMVLALYWYGSGIVVVLVW